MRIPVSRRKKGAGRQGRVHFWRRPALQPLWSVFASCYLNAHLRLEEYCYKLSAFFRKTRKSRNPLELKSSNEFRLVRSLFLLVNYYYAITGRLVKRNISYNISSLCQLNIVQNAIFFNFNAHFCGLTAMFRTYLQAKSCPPSRNSSDFLAK